MDYLTLKFKPTGNIFKLTKKKVLDIISKDENDEYEILDKGYEKKELKTVKSTVYEQIVVEEEEKPAKKKRTKNKE